MNTRQRFIAGLVVGGILLLGFAWVLSGCARKIKDVPPPVPEQVEAVPSEPSEEVALVVPEVSAGEDATAIPQGIYSAPSMRTESPAPEPIAVKYDWGRILFAFIGMLALIGGGIMGAVLRQSSRRRGRGR